MSQPGVAKGKKEKRHRSGGRVGKGTGVWNIATVRVHQMSVQVSVGSQTPLLMGEQELEGREDCWSQLMTGMFPP